MVMNDSLNYCVPLTGPSVKGTCFETMKESLNNAESEEDPVGDFRVFMILQFIEVDRIQNVDYCNHLRLRVLHIAGEQVFKKH
jgi:hypothetical protein